MTLNFKSQVLNYGTFSSAFHSLQHPHEEDIFQNIHQTTKMVKGLTKETAHRTQGQGQGYGE